VLPTANLATMFGAAGEDPQRIAVVIALGEKRMVLLVDGLVGQQEVVIKPIDEYLGKDGLVSGATVRDDGGVSLILDVPSLFASTTSPRVAA
jgi:two-component system chemotaxis sensor kinase CheA